MKNRREISNRAKAHNPYLDYLRALSAIAVVLFHYTTRYNMLFGHVGDYPVYFSHGSYGVLVFFILSGYLTFKKYENIDRKKFLSGRFLRLYPVYWAALVITMLLVVLFLPERAVPTKDFLINFTMLQGFVGAKNVDAAYWTLYCELFFYVIIVLASYTKFRNRTLHLIVAITILQFFVLLLSLSNHHLAVLLKKIVDSLYLHCFMIGGLFAVLEENIFKRYSFADEHESATCTTKQLLNYGTIGVCYIYNCGQQYFSHEKASGHFLLVSSILCLVSIIAFRYWGGQFRVAKYLKPLIWIAGISYPIYLLHQNIGYIIIKEMESIGLINELWLIVPITIIIVMAYLLDRFIGKPTVVYYNKYWGKKN